MMLNNKTRELTYKLLAALMLLALSVHSVGAQDSVAIVEPVAEIAAPSDSVAEKPKKSVLQRLWKDFFIDTIVKSFDDDDTTYIADPHFDWTVGLSVDAAPHTMHVKTPATTFRGSPHAAYKISPIFGWRWLALSFGIDVGKANTKVTQFNLNVYPRPIAGEVFFQRNMGDFYYNGRAFPGNDATILSLHAYHPFNYHKFSYSAAMSQGSPQKLSAGSWFLGMRYDYLRLHLADNEVIDPGLQHPPLRYLMHNITVTSGYAYNWVFAPNWLFCIGAHPGAGIALYRDNWHEGTYSARAFSASIVGRMGLSWNIDRWTVGGSAFYTGNLTTCRDFTQYHSRANFSIFMGYKFIYRKKFRKHYKCIW